MFYTYSCFFVVGETQILSSVALNDEICPLADVESHLILAQIQPASHMYRFACSHQGAARLGQSFYFSIWPLFSSTRAAGGCHWFKDAPAADEGCACFPFAFLTQIFPDTTCGLKAPPSCKHCLLWCNYFRKDQSGSLYDGFSLSGRIQLVSLLVFTATAVLHMLPLVEGV